MDDLFKKLNVLIKSSLNDLVGDSSAQRSSRSPRLGKDIDREIAALRQRVTDAYTYEDELKARIATLQDQIARFDQEADAALEQHRDDQARYIVGQIQRAQQRLTMAEADLREHQLVTQELVERVNTLEAYVAEAKRVQANELETPAGGLADLLRTGRERLARDTTPAPGDTLADTPGSEKSVDDDLERRRQRLSKP